jgi:hypothetical protein
MNLLTSVFLTGVLCWLSLSPAIADNLPIMPFKARYSGFVDVLSKKLNMRINSQLEMSLTDLGDGRYQMDYQVSGLLGSITARAEGVFQDNALRPARYEQVLNSIKQSRTLLSFDWIAKALRAEEDDQRETLPLRDGVVDPLSLHLLAMWDLQQSRQPRQYTLVSGTRLRVYNAVVEGEETLKTPVGQLQTLRVRSKRDKPGSDKETVLWFAPKLGYLPVQMVHQEGGKETLRMLIETVDSRGRR